MMTTTISEEKNREKGPAFSVLELGTSARRFDGKYAELAVDRSNSFMWSEMYSAAIRFGENCRGMKRPDFHLRLSDWFANCVLLFLYRMGTCKSDYRHYGWALDALEY